MLAILIVLLKLLLAVAIFGLFLYGYDRVMAWIVAGEQQDLDS